MIRLFSEGRMFLRGLFWKGVLSVLGGSLGRGVRIEEGAKLYLNPDSCITIGDRCTIRKGTVISAPDSGSVKIGHDVCFGEYVIISGREEIEIGDHTVMESHAFMVDFDHVFTASDQPIAEQGYRIAKVKVGKNVRIGSGCKILRGVTIGDGSTLAPGSVVTKDIPAFVFAGGIPAAVFYQKNPGEISKECPSHAV